jgi:hypothetical protein
MKERVQRIKRMQTLAGLLKESFADRIEKQKGEGEMEEGFKDRIKAASAKEKEITEPELIKLLPICKKEAGKEYEVFTQKDSEGMGHLFVMPKNLGSGVVGRPVAAIINAKSNGTVLVGITNGTIDSGGNVHISGEKTFNVNDTENILDRIALVLSQVENYQ